MKPVKSKARTVKAKPQTVLKKRAKKRDILEDIAYAAEVGGNSMASNEPFGPLIGAAMGAVEEGIALLKSNKPRKAPPAKQVPKKK